MRTLLCDVGGVLVENPWVRTSKEIGRKVGADQAEVFKLLDQLSRRLDSGEFSLPQFHRALVGELGADYPRSEFTALLKSSLRRIQPVWDAVQSLAESKDLQVVALSNMSREVWEYLQDKFGICALFDSVVLSFELGVLKPDHAIYRLALEQARAPAGECTFVDDTLTNVEAAASIGIRPYLATLPSETARFIRSLGAC
ncbi:MAG: HAD-IA family hydrolase [Nitrososphaerota archaeon]|nr:HAD-IA family hydrolase [Nitrososphaerota archaeon]MDG6942015.1 HAD-IA family hydrolase [Nitrososphaerota archaeon]MDG6942480.1 HAD-IA family hydrolase [Nitrososphaerota archaeon]MDG6948267.1 HAD-IA family hydrolase [Nitrososphaerota archaeon]